MLSPGFIEDDPEEEFISGLPAVLWIDLFFATYSVGGNGSLLFNSWPDGGVYLRQPNMMVQVFKIIESEYFKRVEEKAKRKGKR